MPTENSDLISKELFFEDRFGNIQKLGKIEELQQYENKADEREDVELKIKYVKTMESKHYMTYMKRRKQNNGKRRRIL